MIGGGTTAKVNASRLYVQLFDHVAAVPGEVTPYEVTAALSAGAAVTFWYGPLVTIAGKNVTTPKPEPSEST